MAAAAHNPSFAKKVGVPVSVAKDFNQADKGKKFKKGGMMKDDIKQDKAMAKKAVGMHEKQLHGGKKSNLSALKKGGKVKCMATGGPSGPTTPPTLPPATTTPSTPTTRAGMPPQSNAGGAMRGLARAAAMSGRDFSGMGKPTMKKGGSVKKYAKGGGIEVRGKTRGKMC